MNHFLYSPIHNKTATPIGEGIDMKIIENDIGKTKIMVEENKQEFSHPH